MEHEIYSSETLLGVMADRQSMAPPSNYWLQMFPTVVQSDDEWIYLEKVSGLRKLAPLVVPTAQGVPIYANAGRIDRFKPAYIKPKDPVTATRVLRRVAGLESLMNPKPLTPAQRYQAIVTDILSQHRTAIERRWEWMAAQAVLYGSVTLADERYPEAVIDFGRAAGHSITLGASSRWGDSGVSIIGNIESWKTLTRTAKHGGPSNRLTVGTSAWDKMRDDAEIRELLKTDFAPGQKAGLDLSLGVMEGLEVEYVGRLNSTTDVYVYSDYYETEGGTAVPFMDPRDVVLTGPAMAGHACFGAIADKKAGFRAVPMFPKMWDEEDPSSTMVMTQSAPIMVPANPNATLRARVVA